MTWTLIVAKPAQRQLERAPRADQTRLLEAFRAMRQVTTTHRGRGTMPPVRAGRGIQAEALRIQEPVVLDRANQGQAQSPIQLVGVVTQTKIAGLPPGAWLRR